MKRATAKHEQEIALNKQQVKNVQDRKKREKAMKQEFRATVKKMGFEAMKDIVFTISKKSAFKRALVDKDGKQFAPFRQCP